MIEAHCHCKNVQIRCSAPKSLVECNCSLCYRFGALWAHCAVSDVEIIIKDNVVGYVQGDETLDAYHCETCGCLTHYINKPDSPRNTVGVNFRMVDAKEIEGIRIRKLDGADTWKFLDE